MPDPVGTVVLPPESPAIPALGERLAAAGHRVVALPARGRPWSEEELRERLAPADVVVAMPPLSYPRALLEAAPRLRLVVSGVIGVDNIDVAAATELGIAVANCPTPENVIGMAEATVMLVVALLHELGPRQGALRAGGWRPEVPGRLLWGRQVGLIGYGRIGRAVAERLQGWGVRVRFHDPYVAGSTPLDELLASSDVVSLHVVLTERTRHLIGARELALMKPSAVLVNTARGGVVDEAALAEAIDSGRLAGAALDVFETEPLAPDNPLLGCDPERVILTPHCIGHNQETGPAGVAMAVEAVGRAMRGLAPANLVNPEVLPRWRARLAGPG
ncbi:MAG TPA: NAD(P)-dependent oxidoreductase [Candidatus Dormibacteraeota bacterium]|jgi:phosphoglycerate dehydrogenase-like enzyme|nr:NAD(P)-dependent oxidoreductase [Candidatus Dormibacteraeota bacterium]